MKKIPVGLLGATGVVGQQYLHLLAAHPWFEIAFLAASEQSHGKTYQEAVSSKWRLAQPIPMPFRCMQLHSLNDLHAAKERCRFVFSALSTDAAREFEEKYARAGLPVLSNASFHRNDDDVPVLIPEVNAHHADIITEQKKNRGFDKGFIAVKPNCSLQSYVIPLAPLHHKFGITQVLVTMLQAISGAGYPGISSLDISDNVIPYISGEEEKSECEPLKIFGHIQGNRIIPANNMALSAHCNRVPVIDGHLACVSVKFAKQPSAEDILFCWKTFKAEPQKLNLPSAPEHPICYREEADRPQPRLDRDFENGMAVTVGRLRKCTVFDYKFSALSHNTLRGAAGGGILNAELLLKMNYL